MLHALQFEREAKSRTLTLLWWAAACALLAGSFFYLFWSLKDLLRHWNDFGFIYTAGRTWLAGESPYDFPAWQSHWREIRPSFVENGGPAQQPFFYPPHWFPLATLLSLLPWPAATRLWDAVNLLSYLGLCALSLHFAAPRADARGKAALIAFVALAGFNGGTRWAIWENQLSLLPAFSVLAAFWARARGRQGWVAVCVYLAALKPQIGFIPIFYLLLNGAARGVWMGSAAIVLSSLAGTLHLGWRPLWEQLRNCYRLHMEFSFNALDQFFSLSSLMVRFGAESKSLVISPLAGMAAVIAITLWRRARAQRGQPLEHPLWEASIALALGACFVPLHAYDLVVYTPLVILAAEMRPRWLSALVALLASMASRAFWLEHWLPVHPLGPCMTLAIAAALLAAAWSKRAGPRASKTTRTHGAKPGDTTPSLRVPPAVRTGLPLGARDLG
jgi:hypothetical protein